MPAQKKHPTTRARRNKASTAATLTVATDVVPDYSSWTIAALRAELAARRPDDAKPKAGVKKPVLIEMLEALDAGVPELPERVMGWHQQTVLWWESVWSSPMSKEWHFETDIHNVLAAAMHLDDMWRATTPAERQKADAACAKRLAPLGLTPYDRRRLEWTIETAEDAKDRGARRRAGGPPAAGAGGSRPDPRAGLHAVK